MNLTLNEKMTYSFVADLKDFDLKQPNEYPAGEYYTYNLDLSSSLKGEMI